MKSALVRTGRACMQKLVLRMASPFASALSKFVPDNGAYAHFSQYGYHLLRKHYYVPIPDEHDLNDSSLKEPSQLVGIDMNEAQALNMLRNIFPAYNEEFRKTFPVHRTDQPRQFYVVNGGFMAGDAHVYYCFIRHLRPKRIIEIGGGNSTLLASAACLRNAQEGAKPYLTVIEPFPGEVLKGGLPGLDKLVEERLQNVDLDLFTTLIGGDILFIDSTHVLRPGGDVQREYCEILPRLAPGVLVHIHDISLPKPYFQLYFQNHLYWNEQYLLQAFLTYNSRFEVLWPATYMMVKYPEMMFAAFPEIHTMRQQFPLAEPSSFWMRVKPLASDLSSRQPAGH